MTAVEVFAPAKINLTLHVTGRRDDGYHLIDSLVSFAPVGDTIRLVQAPRPAFSVEGPEAKGVPANADNLVLRALDLLEISRDLAITLVKRLPPASGIGGGSADAAAAVRGALALLESRPDPRHLSRLAGLGADIPMCLSPAPLRARGIGDRIDVLSLPPVPAILVNPRVEVPTGRVFEALAERSNPPMPEVVPAFSDTPQFVAWLATQRNDLEDPAITVAPVIRDVLASIAECSGCGLARMSGSGATCFGLFETEVQADAARQSLRARRPDWWIAGGTLGDMTDLAAPKPIRD